MNIDLNCDLGEGESLRHTRSLMQWITSANIACGGHAGDVASMTACVRLAKQEAVHIGAHPGTANGRSDVRITPDGLELLLLHQVSALESVTRRERATLHHIKLHGALYHLTDANPALGRRYLEVVKTWWPNLIVYARAGGHVSKLAPKVGVGIWPEAFADRRYHADGTLIPRTEPDALITDPTAAATQAHDLLSDDRIRTVCVHSDTPGSTLIARAVATVLKGERRA